MPDYYPFKLAVKLNWLILIFVWGQMILFYSAKA